MDQPSSWSDSRKCYWRDSMVFPDELESWGCLETNGNVVLTWGASTQNTV